MRQALLPLTLKCCNPECTQEAQRGQWFCSDTCYARIEHSSRPTRIPMTLGLNWPVIVTATLAGMALAFTSMA